MQERFPLRYEVSADGRRTSSQRYYFATLADTQLQKYTVQPTGIWGRVYRLLAVDQNRSSGVPLNPQYRNPPPGALDPKTYDDPVTLPAADLADNPYWKRDVRRNYAIPSAISQGDVVALLSVGSKANPKDDVLKLGEEGNKQLVEVKQEGESKGLASYFEKEKGVWKGVLKEDGLPPLPSGLSTTPMGERSYELVKDQSYGNNNE